MHHKSRFTTLSGSKVRVGVGEGGIYGSPSILFYVLTHCCLCELRQLIFNTYSYFNCLCFNNFLYQVDNTATYPIISIVLKIRGSIELGLHFSLESGLFKLSGRDPYVRFVHGLDVVVRYIKKERYSQVKG